MSTFNKILAAFSRQGLRQNQRIKQYKFYEILDDLLGAPFDPAVASELWEQAQLNDQSEAQVQELCNIINDAQAILVEKINELNHKINDLSIRKRDIENDHTLRPQQRNQEALRLADQIQELRKDKAEYAEDLQLVTEPFGIQNTGVSSVAPRYSGQKYAAAAPTFDDHPTKYQQPLELQGSPNEQLRWLLWITLFIGFFEVMLVYNKYDFLNLLVVVTILSIFMLNYFDNTYMKVCIGLTGLSIILDIVWLILYASSYWNPPAVGEHSQNEAGYLRFIVFFTVVLLIAKFPVLALLIKYRQVPADTNYVVSLFGATKINLSANKSNLISQGLARRSSNL